MSTSKNTGDLTREEIPDVRPRLSFDQLDVLFAYLLKSPSIFLEAMCELKPEHFNQPGEAGRALIWKRLVALYQKYQTLPDRRILEAAVAATMDADPDLYSPSMRQDMSGLLQFVDDYETDVVFQSEAYGRDVLRFFLQERVVMDPLTTLVQNIRMGVLKDPSTLFARLAATTARVNAIGVRAVSLLLPPNWRPAQEARISTGIDWLNLATDGGFVPKWTYGIFGPFGSFKTGTGIQVAVRSAQQFTAAAVPVGKRPKLVAYLVYEGGADAIRLRALGCAAGIPHKRIYNHFGGGEALSTTGNLQPYENARYEGTPNRLHHLGEVERLQGGLERTANLHIIDMSGPRENPAAGSGGLAEVVAVLDRLQRETGQEIGLIVIDYAKIMIKRYMKEHGIPTTETRHLMGGLPDELRRQVAERFNCVAVILQQLNTTANKRAAGSAQHHADSSEAGDFGENLYYCFTLSAIDKANGHTTQFNATKTRDGAGLAQPIILQLVGDEEQLVDASTRYVRSNQGRITRRDVAESFVTADDTGPVVAGDGVPGPGRGAVPQAARPRVPSRPGQINYVPAVPPVPAPAEPPPADVPPEAPPPEPPQ